MCICPPLRYTYTTMISQCGSHQQLRRALELVAEMRSRGIDCNVHTYRSVRARGQCSCGRRGPPR